MRILISLILCSSLYCSGQTAAEIVKKADDKMRGLSSHAIITITTIRPSWSREMTVETWAKGPELAMIMVRSPARDKGIVYLKRKKEVWNWIPALEKNIKLPPSMMSQSWMGTDFTNDDLVKESSVVNDYDHNILSDTIIANRACYLISMIPKPNAAVVWGKIIVSIDKKDFLELHSRFFDEDGSLVNIMNAYDIKLMDGRLIPTKFEMIPMDKASHKTIMTYRSIEYNKPLEDRFFSTEKMKTIGN
jgi:outer membrane lipoprotein-sorting protein